MDERVGITTAQVSGELTSGISVSLYTKGSPPTNIQGKGNLQEFWTVPLSVADQSEDVLLQIQPTELHLPFSPTPTFWDYLQWSEVLVCSLLPVQPQNLCLLQLFPLNLYSLTFFFSGIFSPF